MFSDIKTILDSGVLVVNILVMVLPSHLGAGIVLLAAVAAYRRRARGAAMLTLTAGPGGIRT